MLSTFSPEIPRGRSQIPARSYPLPDLSQEPAFFLFGERRGQKIAPNGAPIPQSGPGFDQGSTQHQIAALSGHNASLQALERRAAAASQSALVREFPHVYFILRDTYPHATATPHIHRRGRYVSSVLSNPPPLYLTRPPCPDEQFVSNRSLALLRFTRNHDNLAEIFSPVSIGKRRGSPTPGCVR